MKKQQNTKSYDKNEKPLPPLVVRDSIRGKISSQSSPLWTKGNGVRKETDRSYVIRAYGREYRRNCYHIRKTRELTTPKSSVPDSMLAIPADPVTPSPQRLKRTPPTPQSESSVDPGVNKVGTSKFLVYSLNILKKSGRYLSIKVIFTFHDSFPGLEPHIRFDFYFKK